MAESEFADIPEIAAELRVNTETVRRYVRDGKFGTGVRKIGRHYLIPRTAVKAFIDASIYTPPGRKPAATDPGKQDAPKKRNRAGD